MFALGQVITQVPAVLGRRLDPRAGVNLTWGQVQAGSAHNAIPATGSVRGHPVTGGNEVSSVTTLTLGGFTGRLKAIGRPNSTSVRRFRGKKFAIEALLQKRQTVNAVFTRLAEEVAEVRSQWSGNSAPIAVIELDRLSSVMQRASLMQQSVARSTAELESRSVYGLNACDADLQNAVSLLGKLRLEVRVSAARAAANGAA